MASKDIVLEDRDLKNALVLGTGLTEMILSAAMTFNGYPSINLDLDSTYASSIKTVSLKELLALHDTTANVNNTSKKQSGFEPLFLQSKVSEEYVQKNSRYYNIDFQPRVLYSRSISVEKMVEAGMDKYMDFRAVSGIFWLDAKTDKWQTVPISKSAIYKDSAFDLKEKRDLFKLLHTCVGLYTATNTTQHDLNSTMEFDKDSELNPQDLALYRELEQSNCYEFLSRYTKSEKLKNAFIYTIGNIQVDCKELKEVTEAVSTRKLIRNVHKFIKSAGVHTSFPYLYTNYGTGDIPQGFTRVSGVMGSVFIIHPEIHVGKLHLEEENKENEKPKIKVETSLAGPRQHLEFDYVVMNRDYEHLIPGFENKEEEPRRLLRVVVVVQDKSKTLEVSIGPELYYIYPKDLALLNEHPVQIMVCNDNAYSVPEDHFVIYASTIVESHLTKEKLEELSNKIKEFVVPRCLRKKPESAEKPVKKVEEERKTEDTEGTAPEEEEEEASPEVIIFSGFLQKIRGKNQVTSHKNIYLVDDDDFGIDFDEFFERAEVGYQKLFGKDQPMALSVKTAPVKFEGVDMREDEDDGDHPILKQLEDLEKLRTQHLQAETPSTEETTQEVVQGTEEASTQEQSTEEKAVEEEPKSKSEEEGQSKAEQEPAEDEK